MVYPVFDYDQQNSDELNFQEGDRLTVLRKGDEVEREWWWASLGGEKQGYVPRNLLGVSHTFICAEVTCAIQRG